MSSVTIVQPDTTALATEGNQLVVTANGIVVTNVEQDTMAQEFLRSVTRMGKTIKDTFAESKELAHKTHKAITTLEGKLLAPVDQARAIVTGKVIAFQQEERRKAEIEQRRLQEEARKAEEARRALELAALEAARKAQEEAALARAIAASDQQAQEAAMAEAIEADNQARMEASRIAQEPISAPPVFVAPKVADVKGIAMTGRWRADVYDLGMLIEYCAGNPAWRHSLVADMTVLNGLARSQKEMLKIPGVKAVREEGVSVRT